MASDKYPDLNFSRSEVLLEAQSTIDVVHIQNLRGTPLSN